MKLAYVTTYDASDIHAWSGGGYYLSQALMQSGFQIKHIGNLRGTNNIFYRTKTLVYREFLSRNHLISREPRILKSYAKQVENSLSRINPDVVFSPGTLPISYLQTNIPIVFWTDATFAGMINFYPRFSNLSRATIKNGNRMEQEALSRSSLAIYTSEWAAKSAINNYDVDPQKVKIVTYGANINCDQTEEDINEILTAKDFSVCKLLFIGDDWLRKGGDMAIRTTEILNDQGIKTELHIVGCTPPFEVPWFVTLHEFISKRTDEGWKRLSKLFAESHFLILPSRADCVPNVLSEASSFGLPSLATNVGGIPTAIRDGKNGHLFTLEESAEKYSDYIIRLISSKDQYQQLAISSFREYKNRLNWLLAGKKVSELIYELFN